MAQVAPVEAGPVTAAPPPVAVPEPPVEAPRETLPPTVATVEPAITPPSSLDELVVDKLEQAPTNLSKPPEPTAEAEAPEPSKPGEPPPVEAPVEAVPEPAPPPVRRNLTSAFWDENPHVAPDDLNRFVQTVQGGVPVRKAIDQVFGERALDARPVLERMGVIERTVGPKATFELGFDPNDYDIPPVPEAPKPYLSQNLYRICHKVWLPRHSLRER